MGLSEASVASLRKASRVHSIAALQSEYSLLTRDVEGKILHTCRELGITLVPFSPLSRGLVTGTLKDTALAENDGRRALPRFDEAHRENNAKLVEEFAAIANGKDCTPAQLAIAWVLAQGEDIIPIPGTKKRKYLEENAEAVNIVLTDDDLEKIESLFRKYPNVRQRYTAGGMQLVNK